jgi:integrating conjugative element protein (TIGR03755 family)
MKKYLSLLTLLTSATVCAQSSIDNAQLPQQAIESYKVPLGKLQQLSARNEAHQFGVSWNSKGSCGDFDMDLSVQNTLDQKDMQRMMDGWLMKAKSALDPGALLALAFQRANPDLYEMIQGGVLQAKTEFLDDRTMCQDIQNQIIEHAPDGALEKLTVKQEYTKQVEKAYGKSSNVDIGDMTDFIHDVGDNGVEIMGKQYGGKNQEPIESTKLATLAGMNALAGRANDPDSPASFSLSETQINEEYGVLKYFPDVEAAQEYITQVVGETKYNTAEGTSSIDNSKPLGINYPISVLKKDLKDEINIVLTNIQGGSSPKLITKSINDLNSRISPAHLTRDMYDELIKMGSSERERFIEALTYEFAGQLVIEKTLVARRILYTGMLESSIQNSEIIPQDIKRKVELMDWEMDNLERERRFRSHINRNASVTLLNRAIQNKQTEGLYIERNTGVFKK